MFSFSQQNLRDRHLLLSSSCNSSWSVSRHLIHAAAYQTLSHTSQLTFWHFTTPILYKHTTFILSPRLWPRVRTPCVCSSVLCAAGHVITITPFNTYTHTARALIPDRAFRTPPANHKGSQYEDCIVGQAHTNTPECAAGVTGSQWDCHDGNLLRGT